MSATLDPALRNGIGASEIGALFGVHPYLTPLALYVRMTTPQSAESNAVQRRGLKLEGYIAEEYADRHGLLHVPPDMPFPRANGLLCPETQRHGEYDFLIASADRLVMERGEAVRVVEIKTARSRKGWDDPEDVPDGVPMHYLLQVAQQMLVGFAGSPIEAGTLAATVGSLDDYREYHFTRSAKIEAAIIERAGAFWHDHVLPRRPPEFDGSEAGDALLRMMYPADTRPELLVAGDVAESVVAKWRAAQAEADRWQGQADTEKQILRSLIGESAGLEGSFGRLTYKKNKDSRKVDWEAVASALAPPAALIEAHTTIKPGPRVLRPHWRNDE